MCIGWKTESELANSNKRRGLGSKTRESDCEGVANSNLPNRDSQIINYNI